MHLTEKGRGLTNLNLFNLVYICCSEVAVITPYETRMQLFLALKLKIKQWAAWEVDERDVRDPSPWTMNRHLSKTVLSTYCGGMAQQAPSITQVRDELDRSCSLGCFYWLVAASAKAKGKRPHVWPMCNGCVWKPQAQKKLATINQSWFLDAE